VYKKNKSSGTKIGGVFDGDVYIRIVKNPNRSTKMQ